EVVPAAALRGYLHQLPLLLVLLDEAVDLRDASPRARRDPLLAGAVQDLRVLALFPGHRVDDRADPDERFLVNRARVREAAERPALGKQVDQPGQRPHLLDRGELVAQVLERELAR